MSATPFRRLVLKPLITGLLIIIPIYLALLLLLRAMQSVVGLVKPIATLLPPWFPGEDILALSLVLLACFLVGVLAGTRTGAAARERLESSLFERIPGYALVRSFTQQLSGTSLHRVWKPALVEIEDALVPSFIIEELADGRYTVFVPSVPTPLAGAVYVLPRPRVHPVEVPFTVALQTVAKWGSGTSEMVSAMTKGQG